MSIFRKLLKVLIIILIIVFIIGITDYFLINAGVLSVDSDKIPEFLRFLFKN